MKLLVLTVVLCGLLSACAAGPSAFGPSTANSRMGFENLQIENDRFRVSYTAHSDQDAHNYALLRAAQIALEQDYSHFKVIGGNVEKNSNSQRSPVSTSIGIETGRYYGRSHSNIGIGINILDVARALQSEKVTHSIEVRLLNAEENGPDIYDAQSVVATIKPEVFKS